ncbi:MAG: hypothetical protein AAFZ80_04390, partial [Cyanobacteria bacterium P01_A01_bin.105]
MKKNDKIHALGQPSLEWQKGFNDLATGTMNLSQKLKAFNGRVKKVRTLIRDSSKKPFLMEVDDKNIIQKLDQVEGVFRDFSNFPRNKRNLIEEHFRKTIEISNYIFVITLICLLLLILTAAYFSREAGFSVASIAVKYRYEKQLSEDFFVSLSVLNALYFFGVFLIAVTFLKEIADRR